MKLSIKQDDLAAAVNQARRAAATKAALAILSHLKLEAKDGRLTVSATNLHIGIVAWNDADIAEEGAVTVDAKLFGDFVRNLPGLRDVTLTHEPGGPKLTVTSGSIKAQFNVLPAADFPVIPDVGDDATVCTVSPGVLAAGIDAVAWSTAKDDSRPVLFGAQFAANGGEITLSSADGFSLSTTTIRLAEPIETGFTVIVPVVALRELSAIATAQPAAVFTLSVTPAASQLVADGHKVRFLSSLIEGSFPDFRQIVPREFATAVTVDRAEAVAVVKRTRPFTTDNNDVLRFWIDDGGMSFQGNTPGADETESTIAADANGPMDKIAVNAQYLAAAINAIGGERVWFGLNGSNQALTIKPDPDAAQTHVIMPMVIGQGAN